MKFRKPLSLFCLFSLCFVIALGDSNSWALQKNKNGISVYTRPLAGSALKEVKVVTTVKSSVSGIIGLFMDTNNYPQWQYGCSKISSLKVISEHEIYSHQLTDLPWPFSDRDVVADFNFTQNANSKVVTFLRTGMPDYIPEQSGIVRVRNFESKYTLTPVAGDSVLMELQMHLDPGGNIPDWFYNDNLVAGPFNTTVAIIKELPKYQATTYSFIKN